MTSVIKVLAVILVWSQGRAWETDVIQPNIFKTVRLGYTVDVTCHIDSKLRTRVWYKLSASRRLQLLASTDHLLNHTTIYEKRILIISSTTAYTLKISDTRWEDAGTYYCGVLSLENVKFGRGTVLEIEGKSKPVQSVLQRPDYIEAKPGDSVTLSCSFTYRHCRQEHTSVNWVRSGSASRIVSWNPGSSTVACETGDNPEETSCVHNLTLEDISSAEDGTYVCVVIVCGDTLIGKATRIHLYDAELGPAVALIGSNAVVGLVVLVLLWGMWRLCNNKTEVDSEHQRAPRSSQPDDTFTYAAGSLDSSTTVRRRKHPDIYSQVCYHHCR